MTNNEKTIFPLFLRANRSSSQQLLYWLQIFRHLETSCPGFRVDPGVFIEIPVYTISVGAWSVAVPGSACLMEMRSETQTRAKLCQSLHQYSYGAQAITSRSSRTYCHSQHRRQRKIAMAICDQLIQSILYSFAFDRCSATFDRCPSTYGKCSSTYDKCTSTYDKYSSTYDKCSSTYDKIMFIYI